MDRIVEFVENYIIAHAHLQAVTCLICVVIVLGGFIVKGVFIIKNSHKK